MPPKAFLAQVRAFIDAAVAKSRDGLTVAEFAQLAVDLCRLAIAAADSLEAAGAAKKGWVLEAAGELFDAVADRMVPALAWPLWVVLRPAARALLLAAIAGAIESLLPLVRLAT